jgi:hypothetical protein
MKMPRVESLPRYGQHRQEGIGTRTAWPVQLRGHGAVPRAPAYNWSDVRNSIGQLAKAACVPTSSVRYYERTALLSRTPVIEQTRRRANCTMLGQRHLKVRLPHV